MALDDARTTVRRELEQLGLSMESASWIVDDRPPGGWGNVVTREHLHLELGALRGELRTEMADLRTEMADLRTDLRTEMAGLAGQVRTEMRDQTRWLTGVLVATMSVVATVSAAAALAVGRL
ncbi:MAG: hypothetical protein R6X23_13805 [Acidimicrobiia bacterium]|jgi:hypothetical protein